MCEKCSVAFVVSLGWLMATFGCEDRRPSPTADLPSLAGLQEDPARLPTPQLDRPTSVSLRQIVCTYRGAENSIGNVNRNRGEARARAEHLLKLARAKDQDFATLAKEFSNDSKTYTQGGDLGLVVPGDLHPDLEEIAFSLGIGQVSDVVETPQGFHLLLRTELTQAQAAEIVVSYSGAVRYLPRTPRSREQARILAEEILSRLKRGAPFEEEAIRFSDLPNVRSGGFYPIFNPGTQLPQFEDIVFSLKEGEISPIVETQTGFHLVKRFPIEKALIRVVEIGYQQKPSDPGPPVRTREEALAIATEVRQKALDRNVDFRALVAEYSDPAARVNGGLHGTFGRGEYSYPLEKAAFALRPGEISPVVEDEGRALVIKRVR